jgi:hypothetical protein
MRILLFFVITLGLFAGCEKEPICRICGYYTGLSQKVDYIPGTTLGSYTTTTVTKELWRFEDGYTTSGFYFEPDEKGEYSDYPTEAEQEVKGYVSLEVKISQDTLWFNLQKPGGLSEIFEGRKAN